MDDNEDDQEFSVRGNDPRGELIAADALNEDDLALVDAILATSAALAHTEQRIATASRRHMALGRTDIRAIHFLLVQENLGHDVSPSSLARQVGITTASTTKLLDRLERAGHIERRPNPADRRSWQIKVMAGTRLAGRGGTSASRLAAELRPPARPGRAQPRSHDRRTARARPGCRRACGRRPIG